MMYTPVDVSTLVGKTLIDIQVENDEISFTTSCGRLYKMYHSQDCCEYVRIEDVNGDWNDLLNTPMIVAEERNQLEPYAGDDSYTWTFYTFRTIKGSVDVRWLGESNGYYSERVNFKLVSETKNIKDYL